MTKHEADQIRALRKATTDLEFACMDAVQPTDVSAAAMRINMAVQEIRDSVTARCNGNA